MKNRNKVRFLNGFYFGCRFATVFAVPFLVLAVACLLASPKKASAVIDAELYHLDMTTPEYVNIDVHPGPNGSIAIGASTVEITSTTPGGFGLYLSGSNTLFRNGDNTITDADKKIISTTGTYSLPAALISNVTTPATWGYAVAGLGNFDETYSTSNPSMSAKFAAVPATNSEQLIKTEDSTVSSDTTTVYYGINANTDLTSGEYISGAVSYYSVADISSLIGGELTVSPNFITPGQENTITITTSLNTQMNVGTVNVVIGSYSCTSQTIISTTPLTISCTLPATVPQGHYDVEVNVPRFGRNYASESALHVLMAMQNIDSEFVTTMNVDEQYQMYDLRDNKIYFVSRLQDGNVWMTQNLDFEIPSTGITLSPDTTNVDSEKNITPAATWGTDPNAYYYYSGGNNYVAPSQNNLDTDSVQSLDGLALDAEERHYSLGSYYSYALAVAGESISDGDYSYGYATTDICPKGWRLSNPHMLYQYSNVPMLEKYGLVEYSGSTLTGTSDEALRQSPLYFARSGHYNGTFNGLGVYGGVWNGYYTYTSRYNDGDYVYDKLGYLIGFDNSYVSPYYYKQYGANLRSDGYNIRCVATAPRSYKLTYDPNGGTMYNDISSYESVGSAWVDNDNSAALVTSSTPAWRIGYKMIGFADSPDATEPQYNAYDVIDLTGGDRTLYLVWEYEPIYQAYHDAGKQQTAEGYFKMQDMTEEICAAVPNPTSIYEEITSRLVDERDGKLYYVSKLLDGNCWMTQNLDFELSTTGTTLYPETSAVIAEKTLYATTENPGANDIGYVDGGDRNPVYNVSNFNEENYIKANSGYHYHIGSYYNYAAATAGSGIDLISQNAVESVCPKGWRLPIGSNYTDNKSFGHLTDVYGITSGANLSTSTALYLQYYAPHFILGGIGNNDGSSTYYKQTGFYWSASSYSAPHAFYMSFTSSDVAARHSNERYVRANVRCVQGSTKKFTVHYDANGGDTAPADTVKYELTDNTTANIKLSSENPTYGQSTFLGWATTANAVTPEYAAGSTFTASAEQTLYAVWDPFSVAYNNAGKTKNADGYFSMQDMTPEICAAVPTPATAEDDVPISSLIDVRDGFVYFVAKLMDGKCWMTQNLYYQIHLAANKSLSPLTTDVRLPKQIVINNSWNNAYQLGEYSRATFIYDGNGTQQNGIPAVGNKQRHHVYGTIYSYSAAAAGLTESDVNAGNTVDSLCPRGWRMPMGGSNGVTGSQEDSEMGVLFDNYGVIHNRTLEEGETLTHTMSPLHLTQAGQRIANQFVNVGTEAVYWQNGVGVVTEDDGEGGTVDKIYASSVFISNELDTLGKTIAYNGGYLRCVASADTPAIVTFTPDDEITGEFVGNDIATTMAVVPVGTTYTIDGDTITFSNGAVVKAQGKYRYGYSNTFVSWEAENTGTITGDTEFLAHFNARLLFRGITTMQEMTPEICEEAWENDSIRPFDTRDNERYWITKLADGRCWMTEDLDFAIASADEGGTTLYPETSNVTEERNIGYTTTTANTNGYRRETYYDADSNIIRKINNNNGVGYSSYNAGSTAFDSLQWHYRLGAFYGYNIATAGTGSSLAWGSDTNATESICPKGWHLPTAHSGTQEVDNLINSSTFSAETGYTYQSPTYFYRSGYMASGQSGVTDRGNYGNRWTANVDYNIYTNYGMGLDRNRTTVYNWNLGIRCIADAE